MDWSQVTQLVSMVGFPIVCCLGMGWYVKYNADKEREERTAMNEQHKIEMHEVTEALNNNTLALQRLCDKLGD